MDAQQSIGKSVALTGAFSALVIVLTVTRLGFISFGPVAITILHIPVIIIALLCGWVETIFVGAVFGILSLIQAASAPAGGLDIFFVNPLCSVLPRVLFAAAAWGLWKLLNLIPKVPKIVLAGVTGFLSTLIHTFLVIGCLYIFEFSGIVEATGKPYFAFMLILIPQACLEAAAATIVCVALFGVLFIANGNKSKLSEMKVTFDNTDSENEPPRSDGGSENIGGGIIKR